ncbi:hypothetical protein BGZ94_008990 [Podila epigama]|nr:hypothetical protein BGZ94_008990 [Podila epigama]
MSLLESKAGIVIHDDDAIHSSCPSPTLATIHQLPVEILGEMAKYLVAADTISDLLHLGQTCKELYASIWHPSSDIWRIVWAGLYDELAPVHTTKTETTAMRTTTTTMTQDNDATTELNAFDSRRPLYAYKDNLRKRFCLFRDLKCIGQALVEETLPWMTIAYEYPKGGNPSKNANQKIWTPEDIAPVLMDMLLVAAEHVTMNLYWIRKLVVSDVWAYSIYLLYRETANGSLTDLYPRFGTPETLCRFYHVMASVAAVDPYILDAVYKDRFESFKYIRGSVFRREDGCSYGRLAVGQIPRLWFPWSICQIFYTVLFCGPSIVQYVEQKQQQQQQQQQHQPRGLAFRQTNVSSEWTPSWFNFGTGRNLITPLPLAAPLRNQGQLLYNDSSSSAKCNRTGLAGHWSGYYAYSDEDGADLVSLQRATRPEFACRGISLDARMTLILVDWTTESSVASSSPLTMPIGSSRSRGSVGRAEGPRPLYLSSSLDVEAFKLVDQYFMPFGEGSTITDDPSAPDVRLPQVDDLDDPSQWRYQRIFSGRGIDFFGEYGVRGIISERTGLVRMVKYYFRQHDVQGGADGDDNEDIPMILVPPTSSRMTSLSAKQERWRAFVEFGTQPGQLKWALGPSVWYYRGQRMAETRESQGAGIQGLWFTDVDSGPFWLYKTDVEEYEEISD